MKTCVRGHEGHLGKGHEREPGGGVETLDTDHMETKEIIYYKSFVNPKFTLSLFF